MLLFRGILSGTLDVERKPRLPVADGGGVLGPLIMAMGEWDAGWANVDAAAPRGTAANAATRAQVSLMPARPASTTKLLRVPIGAPGRKTYSTTRKSVRKVSGVTSRRR